MSGIIEKSASQEMSISLSQGAVSFNSKLLEQNDRGLDRAGLDETAKELEISQLLDNGLKGNKLAAQLLKPFFSKLSQVGITPNAQNKTSKENEELLNDIMGRDIGGEDTVRLSGESPIITEVDRLRQKNEQQAKKNLSGNNIPDEVMSLLNEYTAVLSEYMATESPVLLDKLKELKEKLGEKGIGEEKLAQLESFVQSGQKRDVTSLVKESLVLESLATGQIEKLIYKRGLKDLLKGVESSKLGAVVEKAKVLAKEELHGFILEALENELIKRTYLQDQNYDDAMKLMRLADKSGLDYSSWLENVWPQKKDHHGLNLLDVPHSATGVTVDTSTDNPNNQAPKHGFEYEQKDENEVLVNRLRALYMQKALKGDKFSDLGVDFKIRKLKNGLFKLGIFTKDMDENVKHEAEVVAKIKVIDMLKEALIERATFYDLAGPANELVEKKIKGLVKNAERLGMPISTDEFNKLRDNANIRMFGLSKTELEEVRMARKIKDSPKLEKKETLLIRLLTRLKEESKIEESVPISC